jgi:FtsP/CotA-like multicopper oxidase with cupredoxin domain
MNQMKRNTVSSTIRVLPLLVAVLVASLAATAYGAAPGITGPTFNLTAQAAHLDQPDGASVYSWGYGCNGAPAGFLPAAIKHASCGTMQVPGPTLIVNEGQTVTVTLTNNLPTAAGNTSILFPGFNVTATGGVAGLLTQEAAPGGTVTYAFTASSPGTRAYYSGTQGDLQVEMGMYGAVIVLPAKVPAVCTAGLPLNNPGANAKAQAASGEGGLGDFRLAASAYDNPETCYDREYLIQTAEMDPNIHYKAETQVLDPNRIAACSGKTAPVTCTLDVPTEPYHAAYFLINGRSMPDDMDPSYAAQYPHQPYNLNPHVHPGEQVLLRIIGQGRLQHPFHEHANHVRILARDGNLILAQNDPTNTLLAGPALFTTTTTPGVAMDGLFYYTGKGLNWDMFGHDPSSADLNAKLPCIPDANGYNTGVDANGKDTGISAPTAMNYFEWCQDHNKPLQSSPFGSEIAGGGPVTLPDANILTNGAWYGGSPYLGPDATVRAVGTSGTTPPSGTIANSPAGEAGFAFMWHSHNERELTTNNIFPGGLMTMMMVDSREFVIDESN